jgi:ADP-heptose:LPS heptosyltransferase
MASALPRGTKLLKTIEPSIFKSAGDPQLISGDLLARARKILFITHFAIGDFAYMQSCFRALKTAYPHLAIHVWVDERRRTADSTKWPHLKKYGVYDWLDHSPWVDKSYDETYSPALHAQSVAAASAEDYPIIVTLTNLDSHKYVRLARRIGRNAFIAGLKKTTTRSYDIVKQLGYRKLDASIPLYKSRVYSGSGAHISDMYADWFGRAFGIDIPKADRIPTLDIPDQWLRYAQAQFTDWGFSEADSKVIFVNAFSKCKDRCWPFERSLELVRAMQRDPRWRGAKFIVNVVPEALPKAQALCAATPVPDMKLFSAEDNFFQLPAILGLCDLIITVETVIMHLANAVKVPVIALMRQTTPEWTPIDSANSTIVWTGAFDDWLDKIEVPAVLEAAREVHER